MVFPILLSNLIPRIKWPNQQLCKPYLFINMEFKNKLIAHEMSYPS